MLSSCAPRACQVEKVVKFCGRGHDPPPPHTHTHTQDKNDSVIFAAAAVLAMSGGTATRSWLFYAALGNPLFTQAYGYVRGKLHGFGVLAREEFGANEIVPGLWLGDIYDAHNLKALRERRIEGIVTCVRGVEPSYPQRLRYLGLDARDVSEQDMSQFFESTNAFIHGVLGDGGGGGGGGVGGRAGGEGGGGEGAGREGAGGEGGERERGRRDLDHRGGLVDGGDAVLVHCMQGVSRSSTVVVAYLMRHRGMTFDTALALAQKKRPRVRPNAGFLSQLQRYEKELR